MNSTAMLEVTVPAEEAAAPPCQPPAWYALWTRSHCEELVHDQLAQVRYGYANSLEEEMEKVRYDFYYLKHMSPWLDLRILFETIRTVFSGRGSADPDARQPQRSERRPETRLGRAA